MIHWELYKKLKFDYTKKMIYHLGLWDELYQELQRLFLVPFYSVSHPKLHNIMDKIGLQKLGPKIMYFLNLFRDLM